MIYLVVLVLFGLTYLLFRLAIKLYYRTNVARYSIKSNFPTKLALFIIYGAFCLINPTISETIVNWIIDILNNNYEWNLNHVSVEISFESIVLFSILVLGVAYIINQSYKSRVKEYKISEAASNVGKEKKNIKFPAENWSESPHLHERLKKYFELKFKHVGLKLKHYNSDKLLFGTYKDGLRDHVLYISYSDIGLTTDISDEMIREKFSILKAFSSEFKTKSNRTKNLIEDFHICFNTGEHSKNSEDYLVWNENDLVRSLINFNPYLKKMVTSFENDKLYSAIAKDSQKKSLAQTFIAPNFNLNENETNLSLEEYINNWLEKSAVPKQLVLLGDYGMGKTSFLKYYRYSMAKDILEGKQAIRFPVYIPLTNCSPRHGGIEQRIKAFVSEFLGVDYELFDLLINKGKILFLLDGFDEMGFVGTHDDRFKQMNELWQLATKNNKLILSGRPSYFPTEFEMEQTLNIVKVEKEVVQTKSYCESLKLKELSDEQVKDYISKYYPNKVEQYFLWLSQNSSMMELCRRPSIMHIIREMLPKLTKNNQDEIYTEGGAISLYLEYWINRQEGKNIQSNFPISNEKIQFINSFFRKLAVKIFINDQRDLNIENVKETLQELLELNEKITFDSELAQEGFEHELFTGYFIEPKDGHYRFVHQSFFDFFVSIEIINKLKKKTYKDPILYKDWSNSIVNFIYDHIDIELRSHHTVPALLLLKSWPITARFKASVFRFFYLNGDTLRASFVLISFISLSIKYFYSLEWVWYLKILLYLPAALVLLVILVFISLIFDAVKSSKKIRFIEKAYKIAFIKNQISIQGDIDFVLELSESINPPHIPIENINFENRTFNCDSFYNLKDVTFKKCDFEMPQISDCHFQNVKFINSDFSKMIFHNCRFTNVSFEECQLVNVAESNLLLENIIADRGINKDQIQLFFNNCRFDRSSIISIKDMLFSNELKIGSHAFGTEEFYELFKEKKEFT
nr:NACHT domain-containing protein [uncultured Brumimicrobium sp.]